MNRLFGKGKPKAPVANLTDCIAVVDGRATNIEEKVNKLEVELRKYRDQMSKMRDGPGKNAVKTKALRILKQKKAFEQQLEGLRNQSFNMEQANFTAQTLKDTQTTLAVMKDGVQQMQKEFRNIDIEKIEDLQDDIVDMMERADEVQEVIGRTYNMPQVDDDELEAELDALGEDIALDEDTSYLDDVVKAPTAPDRDPGAESIVSKDKPSAVEVDEFGLPKLPASLKTLS